MQDSKDYYGLAPGKSVLLRCVRILMFSFYAMGIMELSNEFLLFVSRYAFPIKCTDVILGDDKETILEVRAEYDPSKRTKPKVVCLTE